MEEDNTGIDNRMYSWFNNTSDSNEGQQERQNACFWTIFISRDFACYFIWRSINKPLYRDFILTAYAKGMSEQS